MLSYLILKLRQYKDSDFGYVIVMFPLLRKCDSIAGMSFNTLIILLTC